MLATKYKPKSLVELGFRELFVHRFNFIEIPYSDNPEGNTVSQYTVHYRHLWAAYQDLNQLGGRGA